MKLRSGTCEHHRYHWPRHRTIEGHHIVPQAWQNFARGKVFDQRLAMLCPTGHRNVHAHIVELMRAVVDEDPLHVREAVWGTTRAMSKERAMAYLALCRAREHGMSLVTLRAHRLLGEA